MLLAAIHSHDRARELVGAELANEVVRLAEVQPSDELLGLDGVVDL